MDSLLSDRDSLSSIASKYDVYLSFRGPNARYGFVDHLYECMTGAGLRVFKMDEEICLSEVIWGDLERAIRGSRVYVVVFTRDYASSSLCLRELNMMVDLCVGSNVGRKTILPIFYGVDPTHVKLQTKLYREALEKHKDRHGHDVVKKWEESLKMVGRINGWDSKANLGDDIFARLIVPGIIGKLRIEDQSLPNHLIGINDRVSDMLSLLDCVSMDIRLVVLHGMGGIGKTILAKVIFNKLSSRFEGSSFISSIRLLSMGHGGIAKLQEKLSRDILGGQYSRSYNSDYEGAVIQKIRGKRMLLVLDDVDGLSQLNKLIGNNPEEILGMGSRVIITTRDKSVCNGFVRSDSEVLHFYEMEELEDNHALQLFSKHAFGTDEPPRDYLSLSKQVIKTIGNLPMTLEVIAGHLCRQSKESWKHTLENLKKNLPKDVFQILKVSYNGLSFEEREIFLDIACFQLEIPQRYAGYLWEARNLHPEFVIMKLINKSLIKTNSNGDFWIHVLLREMGREIVRLESYESLERYTRVWNPDDALKIVLQKTVSKDIIAMNLGRHGEENKFSDENFRELFNLIYLCLKGTQLIGDFGVTRERLMWLSWDGCNKQLGSDFFKMSNLVVLKIRNIEDGPDIVGKLAMPRLRVLEISHSNMKITPDVSCCLKLEIMVFKDCFNLKEIHHSIGKLESLSYMKIHSCPSLRSLPEELFCARALLELIVSSSKIQEVPKSIGRLESLRTLELQGNNIRILPTSICGLKNLLVLNTAYNKLDEGILEDIGSLSALEELNLSYTNICFLPATVNQLTSLKSLKLEGCDMLWELPILPTSLTKLTFSSKPVRGVPNLAVLTNLTELKLYDSRDCTKDYEGKHLELSGLGNLEKLKTLHLWPSRMITFSRPSDLGSLSRLETLDLSFLNMASVSELPSSLRQLTLRHSRTSIPWERYSNLKLLTVLVIINSTLTDIELCGLDSLPSLTTLSIEDSDSLIGVSNLGKLRGLKMLKFISCGSLVEIPGLEQLELLEVLIFQRCDSICVIQDLLDLKRLESVVIFCCSSRLRVPRMIDECTLNIGVCGKLLSFEGTYGEYVRKSRARKIQSGNVSEKYKHRRDIPGVPSSLTVLDASDCLLDQGIPEEIGSLVALEDSDISGSEICLLPEVEISGQGKAKEHNEVSDIMEESDEEYFADPDLSLKQTQLAAISHIIGIDHQVSGLIESRGSDVVLMTGICHTTKTSRGSSPRGVGLTTLAKAVYSQVSSQFDACCFLEDIAEAISLPGGIRPLQFKLIQDILGVEYEDDTSYEDAFEVFKEVLSQMKVLIVFDGVEDVSHITNIIGKELKSCLGLGSWIIVTSRGNNVIMESLGAVINESVDLMETKVATELFNWHAFGKEYCETEFSEFVEPIVGELPGCPLLIEFAGSLLHGEDVKAFEAFSKLQLTSDFWEVLAVLHRELDAMQKQIFLDVACFAANEDVWTARYMWHERLSWYSGNILMPFAKVGADDRLWMHSSLRLFGRKLMDEKKNSGIPSHIYDHQSAMDILKNERGTEKIEALCLGFDDKKSEEFTGKNFHKMPGLRFLRLDSAIITGYFRGVFQNLRWLQWRRCPSDFKATNVDTKELLILDLSGSAITEDWKGWENITLINVKVLNLSGCPDILLTPNFSISPELERLILEGCTRLVHIDPSIGTLKHLVYLNLRSCQELNILPQELGELVALRELLIDGTGVEEIPDIGKLLNLEILSCLGCIRLRRLPDSIGKLKRLQKLSIRDCRRVQQLPESIGELRDSSLVELDISGTGIAELKDTISKLQSLKVLRMDSCFISELPTTIEHLTSLEELHASRCRNLKGIPPKIGELKNLRILELRHASITAMPVEVSHLDKLEKLDVRHCDELKQLPPLPSKVKCYWRQN